MSDVSAIRAATLTYTADPFVVGLDRAMNYESDAVVVMRDGLITQHGLASSILATLPGTSVTHYKDCIVLPGFIDAHVHYPQTQMIGSFGRQLLEWLHDYTFPAEQSFADAHPAKVRPYEHPFDFTVAVNVDSQRSAPDGLPLVTRDEKMDTGRRKTVEAEEMITFRRIQRAHIRIECTNQAHYFVLTR